jgi:hypothetical protein
MPVIRLLLTKRDSFIRISKNTLVAKFAAGSRCGQDIPDA